MCSFISAHPHFWSTLDIIFETEQWTNDTDCNAKYCNQIEAQTIDVEKLYFEK